MTDNPALIAIEEEEARLRERLEKLALFKRLAQELNIPLASGSTPTPASPPSPVGSPVQTRAPSLPWEIQPARNYDGTFGGLIDAYLSHEGSSYRQLKHTVQRNYERSFRRMKNEIGKVNVADFTAQHVQNIYENNWAAGGKIAMGHDMIAKLRLLCTFGSTVLNDDASSRLSAIMGNMRFRKSTSAGAQRLTIEHARAIKATAREHFGWNSIALAQAIQFHFPRLRQSDVIGEWVPLSDPAESDIIRGNEKWVRGLRWSEVDENMILRRKVTIGREQKDMEFNLKRAALVAEEVNRVPLSLRVGPMIVCEFSKLPWSGNEYRRKWRKVADKAGVPKDVKNAELRKSGESTELDEGIFE
jgi:hypothetical protein